MGLFGNLFKKEDCCICGGKTGLLDKKTADGKICRECTKKLSVWFEDYQSSTADDIRAQIDMREKGLQEVGIYTFSKVYGEQGVILIDEANRVFTALPDTSTSLFGSQRNVKTIDDILDLKPDFFSFDQIKDIDIDVIQTSREEKQTVDGKQVSYDPPHILYMFNFTLHIYLNHPYAKKLDIVLNRESLHIKNEGRRIWTDPGRRLAAWLLDMPGLIKENTAAVYNNESLLQYLYHSPYEMPAYSYGFKCTLQNWDDIKKYQYYLLLAREIEQTLLGKIV